MIIIENKIKLHELTDIEYKVIGSTFIKAVVDINQKKLAVNAELHCDLEEFLLDNGSQQKDLYGFNIYFDDGHLEYDSIINISRNRDLGHPEDRRIITDPQIIEIIENIVHTHIEK